MSAVHVVVMGANGIDRCLRTRAGVGMGVRRQALERGDCVFLQRIGQDCASILAHYKRAILEGANRQINYCRVSPSVARQ
jgi:hypothetical protein